MYCVLLGPSMELFKCALCTLCKGASHVMTRSAAACGFNQSNEATDFTKTKLIAGEVQGVFLTGTPPKSSKYKKVHLG